MHVQVGLLTVIVARTAIVFAALDIWIRLAGRRHAGELNMYDILVVLIIANAVQNAMTKSSGKVTVAFVSAGTLIVSGWLIAKVIAKWPLLEERLMSAPTVVVQDGQMIQKSMRHEGVTEVELRTAMRKQGLVDLTDVRLAVLEMDGVISVVPKENAQGD